MSQPSVYLAAFATFYLGRAVDVSDPEVAEFEEALQRQVFKLGGRTNRSGYYLDVIMTGLLKIDRKGVTVKR